MKKILQDRSFRISIILTLLFLGTGIAFLFAGWTGYGWMLFGLLPVVLGISIGALPNRSIAIFTALCTAILLLGFLLAMGWSGFICIVMTLPIIVPLMFLGGIITHLAKRYRDINMSDSLPVLIAPLLVFMIAAPTERFLSSNERAVIAVSTERVYPYTPEQVYDAIKSVDTLIAEKPFLMKLDLPVPVKCVLEKEEVGGLRTCYFHCGRLSQRDFGGGTITEKITRLEKAKVLQMDVIDYQLTGRNWLGFKEAIYYFDAVGKDSCRLTRITTYTSELAPRFYWEPMEKWGIREEHQYVLDNLQNDLQRKYGR